MSKVRFDSECLHTTRIPNCKETKQKGFCSFFCSWLGSGQDYIKLHSWFAAPLLPFYYTFGLISIILKTFLLNPPPLICLQSTLRFEVDAAFPGSGPVERLEFAKNWYSVAQRKGHFKKEVSSYFTFLSSRELWIESFALHKCIVLPAVCAASVFVESESQWHIASSWYHPHPLLGYVLVGENPSKTGWLIEGELKVWFFLKWFYRWIVRTVMNLYIEETSRAIELEALRASHSLPVTLTENLARLDPTSSTPSTSSLPNHPSDSN